MTDDETQIRNLIGARAAALRARDPRAMVAPYADRVVVFNLAPPLRQPTDARDPGPVERWLATFDGPMDCEVRDLEITVGGDVAFCTGLKRLSATPAGQDEAFDLWYRVTLGLRRTGGTWQITHEHESVPFEMDGSFQAAVTLRP
jgi:ketosteroid isomerase-like protein